jgi:hypothetical protein
LAGEWTNEPRMRVTFSGAVEVGGRDDGGLAMFYGYVSCKHKTS